jgi:hypothetical protein
MAKSVKATLETEDKINTIKQLPEDDSSLEEVVNT